MVPTVDTVRYNFLVNALVLGQYPVLLTGPVGTGKTSVAQGVLQGLDNSKWAFLTINMSSQVCACVLCVLVFISVGGPVWLSLLEWEHFCPFLHYKVFYFISILNDDLGHTQNLIWLVGELFFSLPQEKKSLYCEGVHRGCYSLKSCCGCFFSAKNSNFVSNTP